MKIGIGLPSTIAGASPELLMDWARRADERGFSSLATIDRLVFGNYESLIALAAAASVTRRIRLMTSILIAPLRNPALLAKQAASLDALSNGRLTLGLGVGSREDDFHAAGVSMKGRGKRFERELALMKRIWAGEPVSDAVGAIGPRPGRAGGPEVLIGGYTVEAVRRAGRLGDGFITGGQGDPARARELYRIVEEEWQKAQRPGKPRLVSAIYFALGPQARERGAVSLRDYYGHVGPRVEHMVQAFPASDQAVAEAIRAFEQAGADEFILWPLIAELEQVDRLADLLNAAGKSAAS